MSVARVAWVHELYQQGVPTKEIAKRVGLKDGYVRKLVSRERRKSPAEWGFRAQERDIIISTPIVTKESYAARQIETTYMTNERRNLYLACVDFDLTWDYKQVHEFDRMWRDGMDIRDIGLALGRHVSEVAILAISRAEEKRIEPRPGGVFGGI